MVAQYENVSGSTVSVPAVGRDVDPGEAVHVPDDVVLPPNYFQPLNAAPELVATARLANEAFAVTPVEGE